MVKQLVKNNILWADLFMLGKQAVLELVWPMYPWNNGRV